MTTFKLKILNITLAINESEAPGKKKAQAGPTRKKTER
jgi:hypothetical protein